MSSRPLSGEANPRSDGDPHAVISTDGSPSAERRAGLRVLVVDDESTVRERCDSILKAAGYDVTVSERGEDAARSLRQGQFDIVLLDLDVSQVPCLELLELGVESNPDIVSIVMTGRPGNESGVEVFRAGAWDYLPKPFSENQLEVLVGRAAATVLASRDARDGDGKLPEGRAAELDTRSVTLHGESPAFRKTIELARTVAPTDASVFVYGESGTGKELIARFIHQHSRRADRPLVSINCAALPETLLESEMFGHRRGAFTGAARDKGGLLEAADGGTVFLDEVLEMPQSIQVKLMRVIQDGVVRRLGSTSVDAVVNVRIIAATNSDPEEATQAGRLRHDLYHRLIVVPIRVPALRERSQDIPVLARHFLSTYWTRHRGPDTTTPTLSDDAIEALRSRPWPGNVRELENAIEHAVVFLEPGADIGPDDIPGLEAQRMVDEPVPFGPELLREQYHEARDRVLAEFERRYLGWVLNQAGGNMSEAARIAGIDRTTIYRLLEKRGLRRSALLAEAE